MNRGVFGLPAQRARRRAVLERVGLFSVLLALATTAESRHHHGRVSREAQAGQFDYYVLSLSWAPTYCLTHADDGAECASKGYGFVLHGLWPQYEAGGYPENCATQFELSEDAVAKGRTLYPSERLLRHEWQAHGTCTGLDAMSYFRAADLATAVAKIPADMEAPPNAQHLTAAQIVGLFNGANVQLPEHALTVACSRSDLSEVHVCLTRDLAPRPCGRGIRTSCPSVPITIPAAR